MTKGSAQFTEGSASVDDIFSTYKLPINEEGAVSEKCSVEESLVSLNKLLEELEDEIGELVEEGRKDNDSAEQAEFETYQQLKPHVTRCRELSDRLSVGSDGMLLIRGDPVNHDDIESLGIVVAFMYEEYQEEREMTETYYDENTERDVHLDDEHEESNILIIRRTEQSDKAGTDNLMDEVEKEAIEGLANISNARHLLKVLIENSGEKRN